MKKIISIALVLVMVFALTAVATSAKESPKGEKYYSITTDAEGSGTASADKDKVAKDATGDDANVTLTATENGGFFTKWIINGNYDPVSGDVNSSVFVIKPKSDIHAIASFRADKDYLTVTAETLGDGTATAEPSKIPVGSNGTSTLTATDGSKGKFVKWVLACDYEIVSGDLNSKVLVIRPSTDVHATAYFTEDGKDHGDITDKNKDNTTSPKTADATPYVATIVLLAMFGAMFAVKKIKE